MLALEQELRTVKAQLLAAIEEMETSNEEMKSSNEEYQSVNEEMQAANEELETSKEEMQSINEELQSVNDELNSKNELMLATNSDLKNLLSSSHIATIFLTITCVSGTSRLLSKSCSMCGRATAAGR